jgi:plasmid maintenance system antidote protein VapI
MSDSEKERNATGSAAEILNEEFLKPLGLTANVPAKAIGESRSRPVKFSH